MNDFLYSLTITSIRVAFWVLDFATIAILARVLLSWVPSMQGSKLSVLIYSVTEPFMAPIRNLLSKTPLGSGMMDFSALFAMLFLRLLRNVMIVLASMV